MMTYPLAIGGVSIITSIIGTFFVRLGKSQSIMGALFFFFQAEDGIRVIGVTGVQTCALPIYLVTAGNVEGGDFMVLKPGVALCGYSGERSIQSAVWQLRDWFKSEGWEFHTYAFDPHFLHLDVQLGMLAPGLAVACTEVMEMELLQWLRSHGIRLLEVPYSDAMD